MNINKELIRVAKQISAMEFPTKEALNTYLKKHPNADKTKHRVEKTTTKPSQTFNQHTDEWFDHATDKQTHDLHVEEMKKLISKAGTKENLNKLHELAKKTKAPWGRKLVKTIEAIQNGSFKNEFKNIHGGKPGGHSNISTTSSLFNSLGQALKYGG